MFSEARGEAQELPYQTDQTMVNSPNLTVNSWHFMFGISSRTINKRSEIFLLCWQCFGTVQCFPGSSKFGKAVNLSGVWCVENRPSPKRFGWLCICQDYEQGKDAADDCRRFRQEVGQGGSNSTSYLQPPLWEKIMPAVIGNNPTDFALACWWSFAFSPVGLEVW